MKTAFIFLLIMASAIFASGQPLTGIKTVPGNYATIEAAIADLNVKGVGSGGVKFHIAANHTETFTISTAGLINATGTVSDSIIFMKDPLTTGNNPLITAFTPGTSSTVDGIIKIAGGDYILFDGLDLQENSANNTATKQMEWGYALVKRQNTAPFNGCQSVTIRNCTVTLNKSNANSVGIYAGNHIATAKTNLTITSSTDACNNAKIYSNTVLNVNTGISINGFAASSPYILYDHNNEIGVSGRNTIANFGGSGAAAYGIYVAAQDQVRIINDSISGGSGTTNLLAGIVLASGTNSSAEVAMNYIQITSGNTTNQSTYGIWNSLGGAGAGNCVNIHHNRIMNYSATSTATGPLYGILNNATADTIKIANNQLSGGTLSGTGTNYGIRHDASASRVFISNNIVSNLTSTGSGNMTIVHTSSTNTMNIEGNELTNCQANGGTVYGIHSGSGNTNWNVYKNKVTNISSNTGSSATAIVYGIYNLGATNAVIYNNFISDLKANAATNNPSICGIYLSGGANAKLYYNSVYLSASSTGSTFGSAAIYTSTTPILDLRNNIFANNSTPGATGYTVAYRRSGTSMTSYSPNSNFNDFYAGTPGPNNLIFYNGSSGDQTIDAYKVRVSPRDASSFTENPPFMNTSTAPFNLHLSTIIPTLCESGGTTITTPAIASDFDGDARYPNAGYPDNAGYPATAPDVGADEFGGLRLDDIPPVISYTPLKNTSSTSARTITATITDIFSGVPVSGTGLPVLYWKINSAPAWNTATGTHLTGSQYSFSFGAGVNVNDVVFYYISAQDAFSTPNVAVLPSAGAGGFTSSPPAAATPPDRPDAYRVVSTLAAGNYLIGGNGPLPSPGCTYLNITEAFADIDNVVTGITVTNGGSGYTYYPTVTITGGYGTGATATANLDGDSIISITLVSPGRGYIFPPVVEITGGGGSGASASAGISAGKELAGHVNFLLDTSYRSFTEPVFPLMAREFAGASPLNTLTLKPSPGSSHQIYTTANPAIFKLEGIDYFTLDGSNSGSETRDLEIWNTSTGSTGAIIWISNGSETDGANHNTIKNCILRGNLLTATLAGIFSGGAGAITLASFPLVPNSYNTYQNNLVYKARNGIVLLGPSAANPDLGTTIHGNEAGLATTGNGFNNFGFDLYYHDGATISANHIQNIVYEDHYNEVVGIYLKDVKNSTISGNEIHHLNKALTGDGFPVDGIFQRSITYNTSGNPSNNIYYNNLVYDLISNGQSSVANVVGIHNNGGWGDKYYFNTVNLSGQMNGPGVSYSMSACFANGKAINSGSAGDIEVLNNIFRMDGYSPPGSYVTDTARYYAHYSVLTSMAGSLVDYNDLKVTATGRAKGFTGSLNALHYATLSDWQTATLQEANSLNVDPAFVSATDLHPQAIELNDAGVTIPIVSSDFAGVARGNPPDIGAYEFSTMSAGWTGALSADWNNPGNWSTGTVPGAGDSVSIPAGTPHDPQVLNDGISCNDLTIQEGATVTVAAGITFTVNGQLEIKSGTGTKKLQGGSFTGRLDGQ